MAETSLDNFTEVTQFLNETDIMTFDKDTQMIDIIKNILEKTRTHQDTGFFIVDLSTIISQYKLWSELMPRVKPFYAVKCNPDPMIVKILGLLGVNFDCASKNEITLALEATGNDSSRIIFANPAKADTHLRYARSVDVDLMTFDNMFEFDK